MFMRNAPQHFKPAFLAIAILMIALLAAGCGQKTEQPAQSATPGPAATEPAKQDENGTRVVKHSMGEAKVPAAPKRVVVLTNEGTEALLALGIKPIGAVESWTGKPWYDHIKADMEGVKTLGKEGEPNVEIIASLKPDLIIANKLRHEKIYSQLNAIAPTVVSETLRGMWKDNFKLYADAVNQKAKGDEVIAAFDTRIEDFKAKAGDKLNTKLSIVRFMGDRIRIYYKDTFSGIILDQIGMARPDNQNKPTFSDDVTKERIPEMEGDEMVYFTYETGDGKASKNEQEWTNDPLWKNLNVVKAGKAHKVDDAIWNTAGGVKAANLLLDDLYSMFGLTK